MAGRTVRGVDVMGWLESEWPTTIVRDRYGGIYSGGAWTAWPLEPCDIPTEIDGDDVSCSAWWKRAQAEETICVGVGGTPETALEALRTRMRPQPKRPG